MSKSDYKLSYFAPKSIIDWGEGKRGYRRGSAKIEPINNQFNNHLYFFWITYVDGKYQGSFCTTKKHRTRWYKTEESAIRSLEKVFLKIAQKEIKKENELLIKKIKANDNWSNSKLKMFEKLSVK